MRLIDEQYLKTPFYGSRRMAACLERRGEAVNRKRVQRLMALMGLEALHPRPRTTVAAPDARVYPYLLRDRVLTRVDEVWSSDITYVPMRHGFMYLTAVIDWYSRYVLSWRLSNTLDGRFCLEALDEALARGRPEIFNTDQGSQFTSREYTGRPPCDGRSENVARAGGRRSARKRGAHGLTHGLGDTMEVSLTPSRPLGREVLGCTRTWRTGPRSAVASSSTA